MDNRGVLLRSQHDLTSTEYTKWAFHPIATGGRGHDTEMKASTLAVTKNQFVYGPFEGHGEIWGTIFPTQTKHKGSLNVAHEGSSKV